MRLLALLFLLFGALLVLAALDLLAITLGQGMELFFGFIFIAWAVYTWVRGRWFIDVGSFIFGSLLAIDSLGIGGIDMSGGKLFAVFLGAVILNLGVSGLRKMKGIKKCKGITTEILKEEGSDVESLEINVKGPMLRLNVSSHPDELFNLEAKYDPGLFKFEHDYEVVGDKGRLSLRNTPVVRRFEGAPLTELDLRLREDLSTELNLDTAVSSINLDLHNLKAEDVIIKGDVLKIVLTPSMLVDSTVLIESDVSLIKLRIPRNIGVMLKHQGEITWRTFKGLFYKDGVYISENYSSAVATAEVYIVSEISKIRVEWLPTSFK